jgi:hypothetical protein
MDVFVTYEFIHYAVLTRVCHLEVKHRFLVVSPSLPDLIFFIIFSDFVFYLIHIPLSYLVLLAESLHIT